MLAQVVPCPLENPMTYLILLSPFNSNGIQPMDILSADWKIKTLALRMITYLLNWP